MEAVLPHDFWNHKMDRMDPELTKALRAGVASTAPSFGLDSDEEAPEEYSRVSLFLIDQQADAESM